MVRPANGHSSRLVCHHRVTGEFLRVSDMFFGDFVVGSAYRALMTHRGSEIAISLAWFGFDNNRHIHSRVFRKIFHE
jgi:hypothetical protein